MNASKWFKGGSTPLAQSGEGRKMSALRVVIIVAVLHAAVLGPILIFEGCKNASTNVTENTETTPAPPTDMAAPLVPPPVTSPGQIATAGTPITPAPALVTPPTGTTPTDLVATTPAAVPTPQDTVVKTVKIQKGDSLWKIAKAEKVNIGDLMRANNLTEKSVLKIGQEIKIPATVATTTPAPTAQATPAAVPAAGESTHVVQAGESLWVIARKYNTTVAAIRTANHLSSNTLKVNQKLLIPAASQTATTASTVGAEIDPLTGGIARQGDVTYYVVGENDRLEIIAKKHGVSVREIMSANNITNPATIRINQRLIIPVKAQVTPPAAPTMPEPPKPSTPPIG